MNEPAIFYTEDRLKEVLDKTRSTIKDQKPGYERILGNRLLWWDSLSLTTQRIIPVFYHNIHGRKGIHHDRVHNLFGYNMTRAAGEAFERLEPDKRILMFSRSSYIGMHRYGGIWHGRQQVLVVTYPAEPADAAIPEHVRFPVYRS